MLELNLTLFLGNILYWLLDGGNIFFLNLKNSSPNLVVMTILYGGVNHKIVLALLLLLLRNLMFIHIFINKFGFETPIFSAIS